MVYVAEILGNIGEIWQNLRLVIDPDLGRYKVGSKQRIARKKLFNNENNELNLSFKFYPNPFFIILVGTISIEI